MCYSSFKARWVQRKAASTSGDVLRNFLENLKLESLKRISASANIAHPSGCGRNSGRSPQRGVFPPKSPTCCSPRRTLTGIREGQVGSKTPHSAAWKLEEMMRDAQHSASLFLVHLKLSFVTLCACAPGPTVLLKGSTSILCIF
jgi:hypothetical protein